MKRLLLILNCLVLPVAAIAQPLPYAVASVPTPVYNSPQAAASSAPPPTDHCGQVRQLEWIAFAGTPFTVVAEIILNRQSVLEVTSPSYRPPPSVRLFVAASGLEPRASLPPLPIPAPRSAEELLQLLRSAIGLPYVWGGNLRQGVQFGQTRHFAGLDCSGLLYEATDGATPRNTADLVSYGRAVPVAGLTPAQLLKRLKPLDLLVWKGHVVIVADGEQAIESLLVCGQAGNGGVRLTPLRQRLREIMTTRQGVDSWPKQHGKQHLFVVRRWLPLAD
jgi:cell wall-associated NlpC family hydrolase